MYSFLDEILAIVDNKTKDPEKLDAYSKSMFFLRLRNEINGPFYPAGIILVSLLCIMARIHDHTFV